MERMEGGREREENEEHGRQKVSERMGEKRVQREVQYLMGPKLIHRAHPAPASGLCFFEF